MRITAVVRVAEVAVALDDCGSPASTSGKRSLLILIGCIIVAAFDGFDVQIVGFAAPRIAAEWSIPAASLGNVFSIGLLGLVAGSLLLAPWADRVGRRQALVIGTLWVSAFTAATAFSSSVTQLAFVRFMTSLGLGAVVPAVITVAHEYAPRRKNTLWVTIMSCGFPAGGFIGGLLVAWALPIYGWRRFFIFTAIASAIFVLPLTFAMRGLRQIHDSESKALTSSDGTLTRIGGLYRRGHARATMLLWTLFIATLLIVYSVANWLPTLLEMKGISAGHAVVASSLVNLGGIVGGVGLGWLVSIRGIHALMGGYIIAAIAFITLGTAISQTWLVFALCLVIGALITGGQVCNVAVAASTYPSDIRTTGIGWAQGIGRIGAVIGPAAIGLSIKLHWSLQQIFFAIAACAIFAACASYALCRWQLHIAVQPARLR